MNTEASYIVEIVMANWKPAGGFALASFILTASAGSLLKQDRKDEIALWLMGAHTPDTWAKTFGSFFDALFGARHLSINCFIRSSIASIMSVVVIWLLIGSLDTYSIRIESEISTVSLVLTAICINIIADYISLLETRFLLDHIDKVKSFAGQIGVLFLDFLISASIIWIAILMYSNSGLYPGKAESFAEIVGVFSIFSVIFYSTFFTSVWSWTYFLSTWLVRALTKVNAAYWLDLEKQSVRVLSLTIAGLVFLASFAASISLSRNEVGLTAIDRTLCTLFGGEVCLSISKLTNEEQTELELILRACENLNDSKCADVGLRYAFRGAREKRETNPRERKASADIMRKGCDAGDHKACTQLGLMKHIGYGVEKRHDQALLLYWKACSAGYDLACIRLNANLEKGFDFSRNPQEAVRLIRQSCDAGVPTSCSYLGTLNEYGIGMVRNTDQAARLYFQACDNGSMRGCSLFKKMGSDQFRVPIPNSFDK